MADLIRHCETCGQVLPVYSFKVGDEVEHFAGYRGTVTRVGLNVDVDFTADKKHGSTGNFDPGWFRAYPNGLRVIARPSPEGK